MKTSKLFIVAILFASSMIAFSPANAATAAKSSTTTSVNSIFSGITNVISGFFSSGGATYPIPSAGTSPSGTSLPINNNIWLLVMAAGAVGCKIATTRTRVISKA